jgi:hypothetical protein
VLQVVYPKHKTVVEVYNIKRSINILGVSDLIAKLKNGTHPYKAKARFVCIKNYFRLSKDSITNQLRFAA